jgi:thymidylate synthase (FAD)
MEVRLISITPDAEKLMGYCARVSNPANQSNPEVAKLLAYCIKHKHWSIFEHASMTVEITTSMPIATQILRHRSFCFQQFSARYAAVTQPNQKYKARRQDIKNRQNSIDDMSQDDLDWFEDAQNQVEQLCNKLYGEALGKNIAKEQARFLLPQAATTTMFMTGNIRSFIHYLELRTDSATQLEHREVAEAIRQVFIEQLPIVSEALGWK